MKILFAGDTVIQNTGIFSISNNLAGYINAHDYKILNFEGTLKTHDALPIRKIGPNVFNSDESINVLKAYDFNVFTLANNHIVDYGAQACIQTLQKLKENSIKTVGAAATFEDCYRPLILENKNQKTAVINCCHAEFGVFKDKDIPVKAGYAWINNREIDLQIKKYKAEGYFVIVIPHAGVEFQEIPLPEWRKRYHQFIDAGADIVIGTHPHIIQGKETYCNKKIYYSIGNFSFYNADRLNDKEWNSGLVISLDTDTYSIEERFISLKDGTVDFCSDTSAENNFNKR